MLTSTADLSDEFGEDLGYCDTPFHQYGFRRIFNGRIVTVRCFEDVGLVRSVLGSPGAGAVLVVDGGSSVRVALLGDLMAQLAIDNDWAGVVINGAVRDTGSLSGMDLGVKALNTSPRRGSRNGTGETGIPVTFGGTIFRPGDQLFSDEDGIVVRAVGSAWPG